MTLPASFLREALAQDSDQAWIPLVRVTHPELPEPLRFAQSFEPIVHQGETFDASAFRIELPDETGEEPSVVWAFGAVDRTVVRLLRQYSQGFTVDVIYVLSDDPDTAGPAWSLELRRWVITDRTVTGTLSFGRLLDKALSPRTFNAADFPALF